MKTIAIIAISILLTGCGAAERFGSYLIGGGTETCHDGVKYIQFTSGASVKYNVDGTLQACK